MQQFAHHPPSSVEPKKNPKAKKVARTAPKNFLNNSRGLSVITHKKNKGFEANRTKKFTRKFGETFVAKVLWATFSVPDSSVLDADIASASNLNRSDSNHCDVAISTLILKRSSYAHSPPERNSGDIFGGFIEGEGAPEQGP